MYKAELELEKRLNDLALANVPSTSYENIVIVPKRKPAVSLEMSPDEFDLRDLAYDQKMNVISSNAIIDRLGWKPSKIKSDVTKAMIQDYQLEQMKNIKNGVYIPASLDLDLLELPEKPDTLDSVRLTNTTRSLKRLVNEMNVIQARLAELKSIFEDKKTEWASKQSRLLLNADRMFAENPVRKNLVKARIRRDSEAELEELIRSKEELEARLQDDYIQKEGLASALNQTIQDSTQMVRDYQKELTDVTQENARRRKIYEDQVKSMNTGLNNIAMLPDETVDEYKQRLADIGDSTYNSDAVEAAASLLYSDRLREKMAEITRDDVFVSNFIRSLNTEQRYSVVKVFDSFKKKVIEIFGQDNKNMSVDDLVAIANQFADYVAIREANEPSGYKEKELEEAESRFADPLEVVTVQEGSVLSARQPYTFSDVIDKVGTKRIKDLTAYVSGTPLPLYKKSLNPENQAIFNAEVARIDAWKRGELVEERVERVEPDIRGFFAPAREEIPFEDIRIGIQRYADEVANEEERNRRLSLLSLSEPQLRKALRDRALYAAIADRRGTTGRGLHPKYPKILPFGLIEVSPHKLFYENVLKITRKGKHLTGFPNVKVSDAFVKFMFKIMDGGQPTMKEVNALSAGEKALFDSVVFTAGLAREVETTGSGVKQDLKNRLSLIEGEIEAGNTNPELIKEARKILQHLARMKIIGHRPATEHLKMLIRAQRE